MSRAGEKLKDIRTKLGLSQKALAKKMGVAESFINEVEMGRKILNETMMNKLSKIAGKDINDITMSIEEETSMENVDIKMDNFKVSRTPVNKTMVKEVPEINDLWNNALSSVLKTVPVYKYDLKEVVGSRQMPVISNKIEGHAVDKVLYLQVEDDDMIGFRMSAGDIAFAHLTHEIENNAICLIEINNERAIRQIKKLDNSKVLLVSNKNTLRTETVYIKNISVIAKLDRLEIKL